LNNATRATARNVGWAGAFGLIVGLSPFSTPALVPSLVAGVSSGGLLFWYLERRAGDSESDASSASVASRALPLPVVLALGLLFVAFLPTLQWLYANATASIWTNGHGLFTPLVMGYLAYATLRRDENVEEESSVLGFAFIGAGLLLRLFDLVPQTQYVSALGLVLCLPGLSLLLLGARRTRALALPLSLGFFLVPIPQQEATHLSLQLLSAAGTLPLLRAAGYVVLRDETVLQLPGFVVEVTEACSGFSALYAAIFVSVILIAYTQSPLRKAVLALAVLPVALLSNIVRVFSLVVLVDLTGVTILDTTIHPASGAVTFWFVLATLAAIAGRKTLQSIFE
jgi:exosortase